MVESPLLLCRQGGESWRRLRMVSRSGGKVRKWAAAWSSADGIGTGKERDTAMLAAGAR